VRRPAVVVAATLAATLAIPASGIGSAASAKPPTKVGRGEGRLVVLAGRGYVEPSWVKPFERRTGCRVVPRYVASSGELVRRLRAGGARYDVVAAPGDVSLLLVSRKDVAPVNVDLVPGWRDFRPVFRSPRANTVGGVHYGISLQWAPNMLLFNTTKVRPAPVSWGAIYNPAYRGKITVPDTPIQIADAALYLKHAKPALGIRDPYELTRRQFSAALDLLRSQKRLVGRYWSFAAEEVQDFRNGEAVVGSGWPYQLTLLRAARTPVEEALPREGMTGWIDTWMISAQARHPNCAYRWLQHVSTPKVQAEQAVAYGAAPVNPKACPLMDRLQRGSCAAYRLDAPPSYLRSIRFWKTPERTCGFGGRRDCVPYAEWQTAWLRLTG
jgi:putative spermidine/putrescine transport system substrate-binding protein